MDKFKKELFYQINNKRYKKVVQKLYFYFKRKVNIIYLNNRQDTMIKLYKTYNYIYKKWTLNIYKRLN